MKTLKAKKEQNAAKLLCRKFHCVEGKKGKDKERKKREKEKGRKQGETRREEE